MIQFSKKHSVTGGSLRALLGAGLAAGAIGLAGCVPMQTVPPASVPDLTADAAEQEKLAEAASDRMTKVWLPAKTTLAVPFAVNPQDVFGRSLIDHLRRKGYAVIECYEYRSADAAGGSSSQGSDAKPDENGVTAIPVSAGASSPAAADPDTSRQMAAVEVIKTTDALAQGKAIAWALSPIEVCRPGRSCLYRVTVSVAERRLSRAYVSTDGKMSPAGAWTLQSDVKPAPKSNQ